VAQVHGTKASSILSGFPNISYPTKNLKLKYHWALMLFFKISSKKVRIFVLGNKLNFVPISKTDENFDFVQELGLKTADYLPHTPVTALGINFVFEKK